MKTLTSVEAAEWCTRNGVAVDDHQVPQYAGESMKSFRCEIPKSYERLLWFCRRIEAAVQPWERCLLFVTDWGIWPSSENWHLYYRLRQSYHDFRLLEDAPGHLFRADEQHDLVSFLQVGLLAGWDMHLLSTLGYGRVQVSHDGWTEFAMRDEIALMEFKAQLEG